MVCTPGGIKAVPPAAAHRLSILAVNVHFPRAPSCFMCRPYGRPLIHIMYNRDPGSVPLPRNRRLGVGGVGLPVVVQSCWGWTLAAMSVVFMRAPVSHWFDISLWSSFCFLPLSSEKSLLYYLPKRLIDTIITVMKGKERNISRSHLSLIIGDRVWFLEQIWWACSVLKYR